jgi:hypothetical protein
VAGGTGLGFRSVPSIRYALPDSVQPGQSLPRHVRESTTPGAHHMKFSADMLHLFEAG